MLTNITFGSDLLVRTIRWDFVLHEWRQSVSVQNLEVVSCENMSLFFLDGKRNRNGGTNKGVLKPPGASAANGDPLKFDGFITLIEGEERQRLWWW